MRLFIAAMPMGRNLFRPFLVLLSLLAALPALAARPPEYAPNRVIIKFKDTPRKVSAAGRVRTALNGRMIKELKRIQAEVWTISVPVEEAVAGYRGYPDIAYIEPDQRVYAFLTLPNDPHFPKQWALHNTGQTGGTPRADIHAGEAWDVTRGNPSIVIAVTDTGIDYLHPDLGGGFGPAYKVVDGYDFLNGDPDPMDDHGHGTHCAGQIAASWNNALGVAGVSPDCKLMALKFLDANGTGLLSDGLSSIAYAVDHGARVISNSWGSAEYSQSLQDAIDDAAAAGVVMVAAAGNDASDQPFYPGACANVLCIGASDFRDQPAPYTNRGPWVDLSAPGGQADPGCDLYSNTYCARYPLDQAVFSTISSGTLWDQWGVRCGGVDEGGAKYMPSAGTSMAAPLAAGAAGLLLSLHPSLTTDALIHCLTASGDTVAALAGYTSSGRRLNIGNALALAGTGDAWVQPENQLEFGNVAENSSATRTVTALNTTAGPVNLVLSVIPGSFSLSTGSLTIPSNGQGLVQVYFDPSSTGDHNADLVCQIQTAVPRVQTIPMHGRCLESVFTVVPVDFNAAGDQWYSAADWGDMDNDGDLDLALAGTHNDATPLTKIFRNDDGGTFVDQGIAGLPAVQRAACRWGDYDRDGRLDLAVCGAVFNGGDTAVTRLLHNDGNGTFSDSGIVLTGIKDGSLAWGDYDNDGDLDLAMCGRLRESPDTALSCIYINVGGTFVDSHISLAPVRYGSVDWGDFDQDGYLDLLLTGIPVLQGDVLYVYRNLGDGSFTSYPVQHDRLFDYRSGAVWGDSDNDGRLDILYHREVDSQATQRLQIYRNNGTSFAQAFELEALPFGTAAWGDLNNDGRQDAIVTGLGPAWMYRNEGGDTFTRLFLDTLTFQFGDAAVGDHDQDGRLDAILTGLTVRNGNVATEGRARLYVNRMSGNFTGPGVPTGLSAAVQADRSVILSWHPATGGSTPGTALTYNLRIGTASGSGNVKSAQSLANGRRMLVRSGNVGPVTHWRLRNLALGTTYYWSVQSVDHAYAGSAFAGEGTFVVTNTTGTPTPVATATGAATAGPTLLPTATPTRTPTAAVSPTVTPIHITLAPDQTRIYPQPGKETVYAAFQAATEGPVTCTLYNLSGERVASFQNIPEGAGPVKRISISVGNLPSGVYFYRISGSGWSRHGKLAVVR